MDVKFPSSVYISFPLISCQSSFICFSLWVHRCGAMRCSGMPIRREHPVCGTRDAI
ncbi:hypothetical protein C7212DRAFT_308925 [Tuber magnatum]|uniref:Uncharacterized protein n=1 Tax=Tuber magnatum TaxID=42249 RepID=A0A317SYY8_9PEZI|nr:hypothetical protein C7212DRAFT_308925 [Tuber magnatum]